MNFGRRFAFLYALVAICCACLASPEANGQMSNAYWDNSSGGYWSPFQKANWYNWYFPNTDDRAIFYLPNSGTVVFSYPAGTQELWIGSTTTHDSTVRFNLDGKTYLVSNYIWLGNRDTVGSSHRSGHLTVTNGILRTNTWIQSRFGSTITVENGGDLRATGGYYTGQYGELNNTVTKLYVRGTGVATFGAIDADQAGGGLIEITNGGTLNSGWASFASNLSLSGGTYSGVLVDGTNSRWNSTGHIWLYGDTSPIGYSHLTVQNNGVVNTNSRIYTNSSGRVNLSSGMIVANSMSLANGTLNHTGGTLRIDAANPASGLIDNGAFSVGNATWSIGGSGIPIVEFRNGAYDWDVSTVNVGTSAGQGRLYIYSGSDLTTTTGNIGQTSNSSGTGIIELSGAGSTWINSGTIFVGNGSTTAGTLNVYSDSQLTTGTLTTSALGTVNVNGGHLFANTWNIGRNVTQSGGAIDVGVLNGTATITTSGTTKIGGNSNWNLAATITGTGLAIKEGNGTVTMTSGVISTTNFRIDAGNLQLGTGNHIGDGTNVVLNGGTLTLATGNTEKIGSLAGSSSVNLNGGTLDVGGNNASTTYSGSVIGNGVLRKTGTGTLTVSGASSYSGATAVNAGTISLSGGSNRLSTTADLQMNGGILNLNNQNQTVGALSGTSNITLGSGRLTAQSSANTSYLGDLSGTGGLTKSGSGVLVLSSNQSYTGSTLVQGGTLSINGSLASTFVQVTNGTLVNNGSISGTVDVGSDGMVKGAGHFSGLLSVQAGAALAPGNSIGLMTGTNAIFGGGGSFEFEIASALGAMGSDWDGLQLSGALDITATSENPFEIKLSSMGNLVGGFDPQSNFEWTFLTVDGGIQNFSADKFTIDLTGFVDDLYGGSFSVFQGDNSLVLDFSAVPEPSALLLVGSCLAISGLRRRRTSK